MKKRKTTDDPMIEAWTRGELRPVADQKAARQKAVSAARAYLRKDARINIRISSADLEMLKRRAAEEGLPYQTLVASILHKFAAGRS